MMASPLRCVLPGALIVLFTAQVSLGELISAVNILSFSLSGLAHDGDTTGTYRCCDNINATTSCGDLCDPYFQICVGRWNDLARNPCMGALYATSRKKNMTTFVGNQYAATGHRPIRTVTTSTLLLLPIEIHIRIMDRDENTTDTDDIIETYHWLSLNDYPDLTSRSWRIQNFTANNNSISTRIRMYKNCTSPGDASCNTTCQIPEAYKDNIECVGGKSGHPRCKIGWRGDTCKDDINECNETAPCQNNATCNNTEPGYICHCLPGWEGPDCENVTDECTVLSPCQNGGMCFNEMPGYRCECDHGWTGDNCTEALPTTDSTIGDTDSTQSSSDTTQPITDSTLSITDSTLSMTDSILSSSDTTLSSTDTTLPITDSTLSITDSTLSITDSTLRTTDSALPTMDSAPTTRDSTLPITDSTLAATDSTLTNSESTLPLTESTAAATKSTVPATTFTSPHTDSTKTQTVPTSTEYSGPTKVSSPPIRTSFSPTKLPAPPIRTPLPESEISVQFDGELNEEQRVVIMAAWMLATNQVCEISDDTSPTNTSRTSSRLNMKCQNSTTPDKVQEKVKALLSTQNSSSGLMNYLSEGLARADGRPPRLPAPPSPPKKEDWIRVHWPLVLTASLAAMVLLLLVLTFINLKRKKEGDSFELDGPVPDYDYVGEDNKGFFNWDSINEDMPGNTNRHNGSPPMRIERPKVNSSAFQSPLYSPDNDYVRTGRPAPSIQT